jgi:hypothetical protein
MEYFDYVLGLRSYHKKFRTMDFLLIGKTIEYLYTLMHSLLLVDEYHEIIKKLNKNNCWACQEGLAIYDFEEDFHMKLRFL